MFMKTVSGCVWFGLILLPLSSSTCAQRVTISVFNDAKVGSSALASAEANASRIFTQAGVETTWVNCSRHSSGPPGNKDCSAVEFPRHLHLRILPRSRTLTGSILGTSYLADDETGCYSDVFFEPILAMRLNWGESVGAALGHVMAHEIAHLILGSNSHASAGIMRAQWRGKELLAASRGALQFTSEESRRMREKLFEGVTGTAGRSVSSAGGAVH